MTVISASPPRCFSDFTMATIDGNMAPHYQWLMEKELNGIMDAPVKWNFQKFMINMNGILGRMVSPGASTLGDEAVQWITGINKTV